MIETQWVRIFVGYGANIILTEHDQYWSEDKTKEGIKNRGLIVVNPICHPPSLLLKWEHPHSLSHNIAPPNSICHISLNRAQQATLEPLPFNNSQSSPSPETPLCFLSKKYASRDVGDFEKPQGPPDVDQMLRREVWWTCALGSWVDHPVAEVLGRRLISGSRDCADHGRVRRSSHQLSRRAARRVHCCCGSPSWATRWAVTEVVS
jgi:hypothetical protein